jgi:hypothetical protein
MWSLRARGGAKANEAFESPPSRRSLLVARAQPLRRFLEPSGAQGGRVMSKAFRTSCLLVVAFGLLAASTSGAADQRKPRGNSEAQTPSSVSSLRVPRAPHSRARKSPLWKPQVCEPGASRGLTSSRRKVPGRAVSPLCGGPGGCRTTVTSSDGGSGFWMSTTVDWCWDGNVVTWQTNSTTHGEGCCGWVGFGYSTDSYCCVGQWEWHLNRVGTWLHWRGATPFCVRNEMHLYGDGHYTTNPGWYWC